MSHDSMRPSIDHSLLSPNGRMSKRARAAATKREGERLFAGVDLNPPPPQPSERERLLRWAGELRAMADRGYRPRYHRKHADKIEAQANALTGGTE